MYLAFSRDETELGFAFPKEWREALVGSEPDKFVMPSTSDLRYNWVLVRRTLPTALKGAARTWTLKGS